MKNWLVFAYLFALTSAMAVEATFPVTASRNQKVVLNRISDSVNSGDYAALYEAAKMPAPVAIPYLYMWTRAGSVPNTQKDSAICSALGLVQAYSGYLQQDIANIFAQGSIPVNDFEILGLIKTPEAAKVAAPYLFDPRSIDLNKDGRPYDICGLAELALSKMTFSDAPKDGPLTPYVSRSTVLVEWQKWAIAKGFVPKDWSSRIGAPMWMLRLDVMDKPTTPPIAAKLPQRPSRATAPLPFVASISPVSSKTPLRSPSATPSVSEITSSKSTLSIWGGVVLVLIVIGGVVIVSRRRP